MPSTACTTRSLVRVERSAGSALSCCGARCGMRMIATPGFSGSACRSWEKASSPPADAPMPTIGKPGTTGAGCPLTASCGIGSACFRRGGGRRAAFFFLAMASLLTDDRSALDPSPPRPDLRHGAGRRARDRLLLSRQHLAHDRGAALGVLAPLPVVVGDRLEAPV